MTSFRQIEANRRNARKSTGPITEEGKQRSRCNAVRHGLTADTVISALEDAEDYKAFEAAISADYDAQSAVERELVLRLASLLWRAGSELTRWKLRALWRKSHPLPASSREHFQSMSFRSVSNMSKCDLLRGVSRSARLARQQLLRHRMVLSLRLSQN